MASPLARRAGVGEGDILLRDELSVQRVTDVQAVDDSEQAELLTAFRRREVRTGSFDLSVKADVGLAGFPSDCEKLHPSLVAQARVVLLGAEPRWHSRRSRPSPRPSSGSIPGAGRAQSPLLRPWRHALTCPRSCLLVGRPGWVVIRSSRVPGTLNHTNVIDRSRKVRAHLNLPLHEILLGEDRDECVARARIVIGHIGRECGNGLIRRKRIG